jgi:single-stranded-DNA-specific exonuclease
LLAVSIASDIVPMTGENRVLAYYGLKRLNADPCPGLQSIITLGSLENKSITIDDVVFKIGPRINAAGRIESGNKAVELLVTDNPSQATVIGEIINEFNNTRKNIDTSITYEAINMVANDPKEREKSATVLFNPNWHKGVIGIVASRLIESYYRPTIILTESNGMVSGSARSIEGFDLYQAIDSCSELLENFGGHTFAAGITLKPENLKAFREKFEGIVYKSLRKDQVNPSLEIDAQIELKEITSNFYSVLKQFQPFGPENTNPVFLTKNVNDIGTGKKVGKVQEHLKLDLIQEEDPFRIYTAIGFQQAKHYGEISKGNPFDICYTLDENEFRGQTTIQLRIKDIK